MPPPPLNLSIKTPDVPGSYKLNDFRLIGASGTDVDLTRLFLEVNIFEDIRTPTITGDVMISDAIGLYNNLPVTGEEQLVLDFNSEHDGTTEKVKFKRTYTTYKVSEKMQLKQDLATYRIYFATPELEENEKVRVSKAYTGLKTSEIIKLLLTEPAPRGLGSSRPLKLEPTFYAEHVIIPYWSPFEAINWLAVRALPEANNSAANFMFFENRDGFNFVSIESLLKQTPKFTYAQAVKNVSEKQKRVFGVEKYEVFDSQDAASNIKDGLYAGGLLIHDIVKKSYSFKEFDYKATFSKTKHTDKHALLSSKSDRNSRPYSNFKYYPTHHNLFDNMSENGNRSDKWLLQRNSLLQQLMTFRIVFRVKGNTEVKVGDMVNFRMYMQNPENQKDHVLNKYNDGAYLVTAIRHTLNQDGYYQTIELCKDTYKETLA